jgi:hypothetical protein
MSSSLRIAPTLRELAEYAALFSLHLSAVIPGCAAGAGPESIAEIGSMDSGLAAEPVIGPAKGRTRWRAPE